jgi:hypothetical protein
MVWDGLPFWLELKVTKGNAAKISAHQIAWHMAYYARGGKSFFLVKALSSGHLYLFSGEKGPDLLEKGVNGTEGARFESLAALWDHLAARLAP